MVHKVLLIEDEREWFDRVRVLLSAIKCPTTDDPVTLTWASSPDEATRLIGAGEWSLIICDLYLPEPKGDLTGTTEPEAGLVLVKLASDLRCSSGGRYKILVLTQFSADQDLYTRAMDNGADDVIGKMDRNELRRKIRECLLELSSSLSQERKGVHSDGVVKQLRNLIERFQLLFNPIYSLGKRD